MRTHKSFVVNFNPNIGGKTPTYFDIRASGFER
jgi:hypothetical protein